MGACENVEQGVREVQKTQRTGNWYFREESSIQMHFSAVPNICNYETSPLVSKLGQRATLLTSS